MTKGPQIRVKQQRHEGVFTPYSTSLFAKSKPNPPSAEPVKTQVILVSVDISQLAFDGLADYAGTSQVL